MGVRGEERIAKGDGGTSRRLEAAVAELQKALRSLGFYPSGHPSRVEGLERASRVLREAVEGKELVLVVGKGGFLPVEGGVAVDGNPMIQTFARELFIRRVRRLTILPDFTSADLAAFLSLLSLDHREIPAAGGLDELMTLQGITTIWVNEIDLSVIRRRRQAVEKAAAASVEGTGPPALAEELKTVEPAVGEGNPSPATESVDGLVFGFDEDVLVAPPAGGESVEALVRRLESEADDERYCDLTRLLVRECERLKEREEFERLLPVLEEMLRQGGDERRSLVCRSSALLTIELVVSGGMVDFLVDRVEEKGAGESNLLHAVFRELGPKAVSPLVERLAVAESIIARRNLAAALVEVGEEAVNLLAAKLADERWYVVRNVTVILGEIGFEDSVAHLEACLEHPDGRVRREVLRSLALIGGARAEVAVVPFIADDDPVVRRQAVVSLGTLRSGLAVVPLSALVATGDLFLRTLPLKKDAIQALGRIGDRRAVPVLAALLDGRHWFARNRWEDLMVTAAAALGQIGDPAALPSLERRSSAEGRLGSACREAIDAILRRIGHAGA